MNDLHKRAFFSIGICLVSLLLLNGPSEALPCGKYIGELYQIEIDYQGPKSYALFILGAENQVTMIDSTEGGTFSGTQRNDPGFTSQLGRWQCVSEHEIRIDSFNYVHPTFILNGGALSWSVWSLRINEQTHSIAGKLNYEYHGLGNDLLTDDRCTKAQFISNQYEVHGVRFSFFESPNKLKKCEPDQ